MFQHFRGLEALPPPVLLLPPPVLQAASAPTTAALTPAPSSVRRVKPDPEGRDAIVGVLPDARLRCPVRRRSSLNCCGRPPEGEGTPPLAGSVLLLFPTM